MTTTPARLLGLLALLQSRREWTGAELADRLETTDRTVRRDIDRLRALGYPVTASKGTAGGYRLAAGRNLPPLVLDDEEALAIAVGLRTAAIGSVAGIEESSARALAKLDQVLPARLRSQVSAVSDVTTSVPHQGVPRADPAVLAALAVGCRDHEVLGFGYRSRDGTRSTRRVEPYRLVIAYGKWYLLGYDPERDDWRTFRVDRIDEPKSTGRRFAPRAMPAGDAATFVTATITGAPYRYMATATVRASAAEVLDRLPSPLPGRVQPVDERSCRVRFGADSLDTIATELVALGAAFTLDEGPTEVLDHVRAVGRRLAETEVMR